MGSADNQSWQLTKQTAMSNKNLSASSGKVTINGRSIFHRVVENSQTPESERRGNVLLLHAGCYSSLTWFEHGTMHVMANHGFRTAAIDMPGTGIL